MQPEPASETFLLKDAEHTKEWAVKRRLRPLYIAAFLQGFVFWYPIEKLFMKSIGYDDASIGLMVALYSGVMLAAETPSGILADRWSRKGVLVIASLLLAASAVVGGFSTNVPMYLLMASIWGLFFALYSGTYDSIVYDTVAEEGLPSVRYEHYFGWIRAMDSIALVAGSLIGGVVAQVFGLSATYFLSVPMALCAVLVLLRFREPVLHKSKVAVPIKQHVRDTFKAVLRRRELVSVMVVLIAGTTLEHLANEFGQLWIIALGAPIVLFGPINALHLSSFGIGGVVASRLHVHKYPIMVSMLAVVFASSLAIIFSRNLFVVVVCFMLMMVGLVALDVVFGRLLHDSLRSNVRAGAASAVSSLARLVIIPLSLIFGYASEKSDVFHASWMLAGLVVLIIIFVLATYTKQKVLPEISPAT